jgi:hypothetical protein
MGREYPEINLLNAYIGLASDFEGKTGFTIHPIKHGLCVIEDYPDGFIKNHKVLQVNINMTYYDQRVRLINHGKLEGDWDMEDGHEEPLGHGTDAAWGIKFRDEVNCYVFLGLHDYTQKKKEKKITL